MSLNGTIERRYNPLRKTNRNQPVLSKTAICVDCSKEFSWTATQGRPRKRCEPCRVIELKRLRHVSNVRTNHTRRAREKNAPVVESINPQVVFERDNWICYLCGNPTLQRTFSHYNPWQPSIDHVIALANGGTHTMGNVKTAHFLCNSLKRDAAA